MGRQLVGVRAGRARRVRAGSGPSAGGYAAARGLRRTLAPQRRGPPCRGGGGRAHPAPPPRGAAALLPRHGPPSRDAEQWHTVAAGLRKQLSAQTLQALVDDLAAAGDAGHFEELDLVVTRIALELDERAFRKLNCLLARTPERAEIARRARRGHEAVADRGRGRGYAAVDTACRLAS